MASLLRAGARGWSGTPTSAPSAVGYSPVCARCSMVCMASTPADGVDARQLAASVRRRFETSGGPEPEPLPDAAGQTSMNNNTHTQNQIDDSASRRPSASGARSSAPSVRGVAPRAPSRRSPVSTCTRSATERTGAPGAARNCSPPRRSSSRGPVGRALPSPRSAPTSTCTRSQLRHAPDRGDVRSLRRAPRSRVPRRTRRDRGAVLHQLLLAPARRALEPISLSVRASHSRVARRLVGITAP